MRQFGDQVYVVVDEFTNKYVNVYLQATNYNTANTKNLSFVYNLEYYNISKFLENFDESVFEENKSSRKQ